jgi:3-hydroxy-9,10-secoandrosta-1,3,5(10)-triene-9,17-dione monooxygenase
MAAPTSATADEILARARALVPTLRDRAPAAERLRRMPPETVRDFRDAGFYRMLQPKRFGGYELPYGIQTEVAIELGRACASSAWDASITACHGWILGMFPLEAQTEVWSADPDVTVSTSFLPVGPKVERVTGGLRVSGRWRFSSGVDHCAWAILGAPVASAGGGPPSQWFVMVKLADCQVEDVWHVSGLAATGSNDVVVPEQFVPDHRTVDLMQLKGQGSPGSAINPGYLYRLPLHGCFSYNLVGTALGAARGMVEGVIEGLRGRTSMGGVSLAATQSVQLRISEAQAELDAAYALIARNLDEINRRAQAGQDMPVADRLRYRRDNAFVAMQAVRAVDRVFPLVGGRGLEVNDFVNRAWRDTHAAAHHIALTWDVMASMAGAVVLGLPCTDPRI